MFEKFVIVHILKFVVVLFTGDKSGIVPDVTNENDVVLRRTNSFQNDPE